MGFINWLDIVIILVLIGGMFLGFWQGVLRYVLAIGGFYFAIVLSSKLYSLVSARIMDLSPLMVPTVADVLSFFGLMFVVGIVLTLLLMDLLREYTDRPVGLIGHVLGGAAGLAIAAMLISVSLVAISFMTLTIWPSSEAIRQEIIGARNHSNLVAVFRQIIPLMMQAIRVWGGSLPPLFSTGLDAT